MDLVNDRHPSLARRTESVLIVIDCQERLYRVMEGGEEMAGRLQSLVTGARELDVPVIITEQYPKGLGPTISQVLEVSDGAPVLEKSTFSCGGEPAFLSAIADAAPGRGTMVLCGVEAHVCVLQTALDLLHAGYQVQIVADATTSRNREHHALALQRLQAAGAVITCIESVLFEWLERCDHDSFKAISKLVK